MPFAHFQPQYDTDYCQRGLERKKNDVDRNLKQLEGWNIVLGSPMGNKLGPVFYMVAEWRLC